MKAFGAAGGVKRRASAGGGMGPVLLSLATTVIVVNLTACGPLVKMKAPSPEGPRISRMEWVGPLLAGCLLTLRVHIDASDSEMRQAVVGWVRLAGRPGGPTGRFVLPIQNEPSTDVVARLSFPRWGTYSYRVQLVDLAGRWSNVLSGRVVVPPAPAGATPPCS